MGNIATLNVKLTAGLAGSFAASMNKGKALVSGFSSSVAGATTKLIGLSTGLAAVATGGGMALLVKSQMDAIDKTAKLSDRLGIQTEKLIGLQHAADLAGVAEDQLTGGIERMLKSLGGAVAEGGKADAALTSLGLNSRELANMPVADAFTKIADKISAMANTSERARVTTELFGRGGMALESLFQAGAKGIEAAQLNAEKLNLTLSRTDAAKVESASDSMGMMGDVVKGIGNSLAVELSPYIDAAATKLVNMASSGGGLGPKVGGAVEWVASSIAKATDYTNLFEASFYGLRAGAVGSLGKIVEAADYVGSALTKALKLTGMDVTWTDSLENFSDGLAKESAQALAIATKALDDFDRGTNATAAAAFFDDLRAKAEANAKAIADNAAKMNGGALAAEGMADKLELAASNAEKVTSKLADLQAQVDQSGMTESQKKLADLAGLNADPEQLSKAEKLLAHIEKQSAAKTLSEKAQQLVESIQTPLDQYNDKLSDLNEMLAAKLLSRGEFDKLSAQALADSKGGVADKSSASNEMFMAGSAAAQRFAFEQSRGVNALSNRNDVPKKHLKEAQTTNTTLVAIQRELRARQNNQFGTGDF